MVETTHDDEFCCGHATYNLWFMLIVYEKYMFDGDKEGTLKYENFIYKSLTILNNLIKTAVSHGRLPFFL